MKKHLLKSAFQFQSVFILMMLIVFRLGCKKDKEKGCTDPNAKNYNISAEEDDGSCVYPVLMLQAKVDGILVVCDSTARVDTDLTDLFGITGNQTNGYNFNLKFPVAQGIGNYNFLTFTSPSSFMNEAFVWHGNMSYHSADGFVTITHFSENNVKGTFSFKGIDMINSDTVQVTEGMFDIDYNY